MVLISYLGLIFMVDYYEDFEGNSSIYISSCWGCIFADIDYDKNLLIHPSYPCDYCVRNYDFNDDNDVEV